MESLLALIGVIVGIAQLRRTPKPKHEPEPFTPTSTLIVGVQMDRGRDLFGRR
jgi:hypothetical protein